MSTNTSTDPADAAGDMRQTWAAVDALLGGLLVGDDPELAAATVASAQAGLPNIAVSPVQGKLLHLLARLCGARRILELGTLGGYSTIWLARALPADGRLITLEYDPHHAQVARDNIARAGLAERVDIRIGAALDTLPQLESEAAGPFDLVFIDADKPSYPDYLAWALRLTRPGSVIIGDNVVRAGKIVDPDPNDDVVRGVRLFNEHVAAEPRLDATALQTVGVKGYDGFTIALVR